MSIKFSKFQDIKRPNEYMIEYPERLTYPSAKATRPVYTTGKGAQQARRRARSQAVREQVAESFHVVLARTADQERVLPTVEIDPRINRAAERAKRLQMV